MIKKNKWKLLIASLVTLLPSLFGAIVWDRLPELITTHWGVSGEADGASGRLFVVLGLPLILLTLFWLAIFVTAWDHKKKEQDAKVYTVVFMIVPIISLWVNGIIYATAFGFALNPMVLMGLLLGVMFLATGNYMPKCRPNFTIGIKTRHTLSNEENWRATHHFGGRLWFVCGILALICAFLPAKIAPFVMGGVLVLAILPVFIYPSVYARKQIREGRATKESFKLGNKKVPVLVTVILLTVILALVAVLMFTGNVECSFGESSVTVDAAYTGRVEIDYERIERVEYRESLSRGQRTAGFGSARLLTGLFHNEEFGSYRLYAYTGCDASAILYMKDGNVIVLGGSNVGETQTIYHTLSQKIK